MGNFIISELIMTEVSKDLRNIFLSPKPPILKVEVGIFSDKKTFSQNGYRTNYERSFSEIREHFFRGKKCLLPMGNLIIFFQNTPDFEN